MADDVAVDAHPLADVDQVRAGIQPGLVAGGGQHRRDHRASAALTFSSGDVDRAEVVLRVAEFLEQQPHPVQIEVLRVIADDAQPLEVVERVDEP